MKSIVLLLIKKITGHYMNTKCDYKNNLNSALILLRIMHVMSKSPEYLYLQVITKLTIKRV